MTFWQKIKSVRQILILATIPVLALFLSGCFTQQLIFWSPDGKQAAVLSQREGANFFLTDSQGKMSGAFLTNVEAVTWLPDSKGLVISRALLLTNWAELSKMISMDQRSFIAIAGNKVWQKIEKGEDLHLALSAWHQEEKQPEEIEGVIGLYLRDKIGRQNIKISWDQFTNISVPLTLIQIGQIEGETIKLGSPLSTELIPVFSLKVSPEGKNCLIAQSGHKLVQTKVIPLDGSQKTEITGENTLLFSDWSSDSRSIYFIQPEDDTVSDLRREKIALGYFCRRSIFKDKKVQDETGDWIVTNATERLAELVLTGLERIRCVPDGRVIFSGCEITFPATQPSTKELYPKLFLFDPQKPESLTKLILTESEGKLGDDLSSFEISPDGTQISMLGEKGEVKLLTLASGKIETIQTPQENGTTWTIPVWHGTNELCFMRHKAGTKEDVEVVLWKNGTTQVISETWPANFWKESK